MKYSVKKVLALILAVVMLLQSGIVSPHFIAEAFADDNVVLEQESPIDGEATYTSQ